MKNSEKLTEAGIVVPSDETVLWRYMSYVRFEELVRTSKLCFSRIDQFSDFNEGGFSTATRNRADVELASQGAAHLKGLVSGFNQYMNWKYWYGSCWNCCSRESNLLWRAYGASHPVDELHFKVAIRTTVSNLMSSIKRNNLYLGKVRYLDDSVDPYLGMEGVPSEAVVYTKQLEYADEAEVRVAILDTASMVGGFPISSFPETSKRIFVDIDLHTLFDEVIVEAVPLNWEMQGNDNPYATKGQRMQSLCHEIERRVEKTQKLLFSSSAHEVALRVSNIL